MERRPVLAVTFALLMLASTVTMSGAAAAFGDSHDDLEPREPALTYQQPVLSEPAQSIGTPNGTTDEGLPSITDPRLNPHQRVALANITLHDIEGESRQEERALSQARDRIETALDHYEAGRATSRQAFDAQARTLQALARMTGGSHDSTIRNVSEGLFLASNESARIAVRDANGSLRTFSNDLDRNERRFVENALGNAEAAFDRADRMAEPRGRGNGRNALRRQVQSRANAIDHYRAGYHHAGRALDRMERAVDPELSLSQGQAFERNDSVHVVVDTTLTDIRPYAYDEATVTVTNGSANASAIRFRRAIPGSSYTTGSTIVDLGPDAENVTLTVSSNASHDESRKVEETIELSVENVEVIPDPPDPDEYNEVELRNESTGVSVEAAGEGLWEERMRITNETPASDQAFRAAPVVRVES